MLLYRDYLIAQITNDLEKADELWKDLSNEAKEQLNKLILGIDNYRGKHVSAPIGSTWKAHDCLKQKVNTLADEYLNELIGALMSSADSLDFKC